MERKEKKRFYAKREHLKNELAKLLQDETGTPTKESLAYYLQLILRRNALGEMCVPTHVVDWLIMVSYMPKPDIYILQLLISVIQEEHNWVN